MRSMNHGAESPAIFAGVPLDRYHHVCAFANGTPEEQHLFDTFACDGIDRGETVSYIVNPANVSATISHFEELGVKMSDLLANGAFELRTWDETHLVSGRFDADTMIALAEDGMRASPRRIRMVSDMGWAVDYQSKELIAYEARANLVMAAYNHVVICVYDISRFNGDIIVDVLRTHPLVLIGGLLHVNPFYVPPGEMLAELHRDASATTVPAKLHNLA